MVAVASPAADHGVGGRGEVSREEPVVVLVVRLQGADAVVDRVVQFVVPDEASVYHGSLVAASFHQRNLRNTILCLQTFRFWCGLLFVADSRYEVFNFEMQVHSLRYSRVDNLKFM